MRNNMNESLMKKIFYFMFLKIEPCNTDREQD